MAVDPELAATIQTIYRNWLEGSGAASRAAQREMIAFMTRYLCQLETPEKEPGICLVEGGTGTGKTLAYLLATLPATQRHSRHLIIATATTTLQAQILEKDLPDLARYADFPVHAVLAKGRGRYLCLQKLDLALQEHAQGQLNIGADGDPGQARGQQLLQIQEAFNRGWDGDLDAAPGALGAGIHECRGLLTMEHQGCLRSSCPDFDDCPYYEQRRRQESASVIVANHDLLLSDLQLGGGAVLPEPENSVYVIDEAHHFADKALQHFARGSSLSACRQQLSELLRLINAPEFEIASSQGLHKGALQHAARAVNEALQPVQDALTELQLDWRETRDERSSELVLLPAEIVHTPFAGALGEALPPLGELLGILNKFKEEQTDESGVSAFLVQLASLRRSLEDLQQTFTLFTRPDPQAPEGPPLARWLTRQAQATAEYWVLHASPTAAADYLESRFWQRCHGAILTSATLSEAGDFSFVRKQLGAPQASVELRVSSPFNYPAQAQLLCVDIGCNPADHDAWYRALTTALTQVVNPDEATLILFTARRHLQEVMRYSCELQPDWPWLMQDQASRQALIETHKARIAQGQGSILVGLNSFSEGLDLPGEGLTHVVLTRIPFTLPDHPLDQTYARWYSGQGGNPFRDLSLPQAGLRLVQACGRLLRHERDRGRITILDRRLWQREYGAYLLGLLPAYHRPPPRKLVLPADIGS